MEAFIKKRVPKKVEEEKVEEEKVEVKEIEKEVEKPKPEIKTKTSEIIKHLKAKGSITSMEAFELYGATRLSAIVFSLRKKGYDITTEEESCVDRYGHVCSFARYILHED